VLAFFIVIPFCVNLTLKAGDSVKTIDCVFSHVSGTTAKSSSPGYGRRVDYAQGMTVLPRLVKLFLLGRETDSTPCELKRSKS
jgi:hypothetical protein